MECPKCSSDQVTKEFGPKIRTRLNRLRQTLTQTFSLYHCRVCGKNFEVATAWERDDE